MGAAIEDVTRVTDSNLVIVRGIGDVELVVQRFVVPGAHSTGGASNRPTEAVDLLIEKIRRIGHGYRNFDNYRRRLLLGCGIQWTTVPTHRIRGLQPAFAA